MTKLTEAVVKQLEQRENDLEDAGIASDRVGRFLTVLMAQLDIDLPLRINSAPAAATFLQSHYTGHSDALQQVRADELLTAVFEDLHDSKIAMMPQYEKELGWKEAGELDEEDLAMTETLGRRIKGLEGSIMKISEMRENSNNSFEHIKVAAESAKQYEQSKATTSMELPSF